ncbi:MAG TPA: SMI1/KNR4 family protein [Candidatus Limnocylindrales bacterium]
MTMLSVEKIVRRIREADESAVAGLDRDAIQQVQAAWQVDYLPERYVAFLAGMGMRAGQLLVGTDAFFPRILEMREWAISFFDENDGWMRLPDGALVFAMHQGYLVYWFSDSAAPDPEVVLYMEQEKEPVHVWPSFTGFLNEEYETIYRSPR